MSGFVSYVDEANVTRLRAKGGAGATAVVVTFTAAQVAAAYDGLADAAALPMPSLTPDAVLTGALILASTLDAGSAQAIAAYLPNATTAAVSANSETLTSPATPSAQTYSAFTDILESAPGAVRYSQLLPGCAAYLLFGSFGGGAPTSGSVTVRVLLAA